MPGGYKGWGRNWKCWKCWNTNIEKQGNIKIMVENMRKRVSGMSNWNAPGPDGVKGLWFKKFTDLNDRVAKHSPACLNTGIEPPWVTKGRILLIMKDRKKDGVASSYRPIACLNIMWKLLTGINGDEI